MLGGNLSWADAAKQITRHLHKLVDDQQRVMVFSCCHSKDGFEATKAVFKDYFTGAYYFNRENIPFAYAITVWGMFYLKKKLNKPHGAIVEAVNKFLDEDLLAFKTYS